MVVNDYQTKQAIKEDKRRFAQAEQDVQKVTANIIAATGEPYKKEYSESCFLRSVKFEEQPISCSVDTEIYYSVDDADSAENLFNNISQKIQRAWILKEGAQTSDARNPPFFRMVDLSSYQPTKDYQQIFEVYLDNTTSMTCRVTYVYYYGSAAPDESYLTKESDYLLNVSIGCSGDAKITHYPVRE